MGARRPRKMGSAGLSLRCASVLFVPRHPLDARRTRGERDDDALALLRGGQGAWIDGELRLARLLHRIDAKAAFVYDGGASMREYGERCGYDPDRVDDLLLLGYALVGEPRLEEALRAGKVGWVSARTLGRIYRDPRLLREGDDWLGWASSLSIRDLRKRVRERVESVFQEAPAVHTFAVAMSEETKDEVEVSRRIALRKARQRLTNGQLLRVLATTYNDLFDPLRKDRKRRRMPPTSEQPHARGVPAEVVRAIHERSGGLCEFGPCERVAEELCHLTPHAEGSAREVKDLVHGCHRHHSQLDAGILRFLGWTDDDRPSFLVAASLEILLPKPAPENGYAPPRPEWLVRATRRHGAPTPKRLRGDLGTYRSGGDGPETTGDTEGTGRVADGCSFHPPPARRARRKEVREWTGPRGPPHRRRSASPRRRPGGRGPPAAAPS